ncbi:hypothetical protein QYE76_018654 [Lolium multiflorum]|uniref:ERCC3/RAD25/XPB helicase C-terminal domain-containing protein n=1 Tax=Lolium multiflorum TaxID=4521 RepID=A0AAD8QH54_LOLMU|nr:hypothetical protein QYE76_018654 [Lolium multiflorum]
MEGRKEECNTFFYPLVSTDTGVGMLINFSTTSFALMHNKKRTIPYSFKVITSLPPHEGPNLSFHALDEQFDLLDKVLNTWDNMVGVEHLEEDSDGKARLKARHSGG